MTVELPPPPHRHHELLVSQLIHYKLTVHIYEQWLRLSTTKSHPLFPEVSECLVYQILS